MWRFWRMLHTSSWNIPNKSVSQQSTDSSEASVPFRLNKVRAHWMDSVMLNETEPSFILSPALTCNFFSIWLLWKMSTPIPGVPEQHLNCPWAETCWTVTINTHPSLSATDNNKWMACLGFDVWVRPYLSVSAFSLVITAQLRCVYLCLLVCTSTSGKL